MGDICAKTENNHFISPLPYDRLNDLCERARTNHDPQDFIKYQLSNKHLREVFSDCEKLEKWDCYGQAKPNMKMITYEVIRQYKEQKNEERCGE